MCFWYLMFSDNVHKDILRFLLREGHPIEEWPMKITPIWRYFVHRELPEHRPPSCTCPMEH
jgi:hypothetical protein